MEAVRRAAVASPLPLDRRRVLSREQARSVYDRAGAKVRDSDSVYGGPAVSALLAAARLGACGSVFEFGCGGGRLADRLLRRGELAPGARYVAVDASPVMAGLAAQRAQDLPNASVRLLESGDPALMGAGEADGSFAAVISTYVLDILPGDDVASFLSEAWRLLEPGGALCLVNLGEGCTPATRAGSAVWAAVHAVAPTVVGGCRAQRLLEYLGPGWEVRHHELVAGGFVASEVLVATKLPGGGGPGAAA
ncbi:MAG: S-adenosyl-L-methionine-dependent methyltransferase [Monoraphidium minutum]|nr:MAG: S-adenosyl-L-methionine-dependent methyltransferase [Monoraphidium minutum]